MLIEALHVHPGNRPAVPHKRLTAVILDHPPLGVHWLQITRFLVDQLLTATLHSRSAPFAGIDKVNGFVTQVNLFRSINTLQKFIPQVRTLVINAESERIVAMPVGGGDADGVIRVDEVVGSAIHIELGEQGAFHAELQAVVLMSTQEPVHAECLFETDLCHGVSQTR
jgi:hypothetical protein